MEKDKILEKVIEVCKDVFDDESVALTENSCSENVEAWDSLSHLNIMSDLEDEFGIKFTLDEITNFKNLGEIVNAIETKLV